MSLIKPTNRLKQKKRWRWLIGILVGVIVLAALLFFPTNYYLEVPGSAESLKPYVKVTGSKDNAKGSYMLTTVGVVGPASPALLLFSKTQAHTDIVSKQDLMGNDSSAEYDQLQAYYMKSAANNAVAAAFKAAKKPYQIHHRGIYVMSILPQSPFKGKLALGDTITKLNGKSYKTADAYVNAIKSQKVGAAITLTYQHQGKTKQATAKLIRLPQTKRAGIGITLTENTAVTSDPKVKIDAGNIGGPSAGTMFALQIYTQITHQNLRRGHVIAGTGTIDPDGHVGQIGGIDKKVVAADAKGAKVFFAPNQPATKKLKHYDPNYVNNYTEAVQTAKQIKTKMKIVPVKTLSDVIRYMENYSKTAK
ncbi:SepM family pheromone-processing serine protease [Lacticaseibacillus parahuelsenbergensis]|uniref:endopeptidase La n=1 Tax=Lacticaseibacillus parahuelsenbergensis TaxID=3068305 RepID=A0ABY9L674_9LACO|nr:MULTISPECIES: SepM family pheromone-processing serine protease [Lacticaseibacillus]MDE3282297.1 PDZ domain-containing protein [Lacticaseibacillus casei]WLV79184.1 SepM family pheromone-processing serine protease [Lacticaseibacillus sp. NCIMB 15471]